LTITDSLAHGLQRLGRFEEAEPIFQEIVGIYQSHFPMSNEHFRALKSHGSVLVSLNQFERAEKTLLQVWTALDESSEKVAPARRNVYLREIAASFQKLYAAMDDSANQQKWTKILNELNQE
jgi:tetratricopeptide (TPR) repeat protein